MQVSVLTSLKNFYKSAFTLACLLFLISLQAPAIAAGDRDVLYQVSTISALMDGGYDGVESFNELTRHGDFGIGTFDSLDGEMVELDGKAYQIKSDGKVYPVEGKTTTPFAAVKYFDADRTASLDGPADLDALKAFIDRLMPDPNLMYAVRVTGTFKKVKTRSVPRQARPYPKLMEVVKAQPTFELADVRGTLIGFRLPAFMDGINVPGYHFHFITEDRKYGGHVLACEVTGATVQLDGTARFEMMLPESSGATAVSKGAKDELEKIEK